MCSRWVNGLRTARRLAASSVCRSIYAALPFFWLQSTVAAVTSCNSSEYISSGFQRPVPSPCVCQSCCCFLVSSCCFHSPVGSQSTPREPDRPAESTAVWGRAGEQVGSGSGYVGFPKLQFTRQWQYDDDDDVLLVRCSGHVGFWTTLNVDRFRCWIWGCVDVLTRLKHRVVNKLVDYFYCLDVILVVLQKILQVCADIPAVVSSAASSFWSNADHIC